ncbi:MAG TPA: hypothetical protein VFY29_05430 [Terriglobia bacterium]|nr:hypothetical protein [Terriglobia bacterium]
MKRSTMFKGAMFGVPVLLAGLVVAGQGQTGSASSESAKTAAEQIQKKGKDLAEKECTVCHDLDLAASLRYTRPEWEGLVQSMIDKGSALKKEDAPAVAEYLAANYGVRQLVEEACSTCHDFTPVAEQRLSRADWDNLVRSMVDRGAPLNAAQIVTAVDYLTATYPIAGN